MGQAQKPARNQRKRIKMKKEEKRDAQSQCKGRWLQRARNLLNRMNEMNSY